MRWLFFAGLIPAAFAAEDRNVLTTVYTAGSATLKEKEVTDAASTARPSPHNERVRQRDVASTTCHI